jgi:hypothetical protein
MYYIDNEYLKQYLQTGQNISVLVNKEYLAIADESDVESSDEGVGYNTYGKAQKFDYKAIEAVKIGPNIYTLDQLNQKLNPQKEPPKKSEPSEKGKDEITIDPDKKESISKNDYIINLDPKSPYYRTRGSIVSLNEEMVVYQTYVDNTFQKVSCLLKYIAKE